MLYIICFLAFLLCSTTAEILLQKSDVELVQECFNAAYNRTPTTFGSYMSSWPVSLRIPYVWSSAKQGDIPLTVFTTATLDRLHHLEALCQMLPGGFVSAAVYQPLVQPRAGELDSRNAAILRVAATKLQDLFVKAEAAPTGCSLRLLLLTEVAADRGVAALVPINALRNAALLAVRTPLAAMIDVDLAPSDSLLLHVLRNASRVLALQRDPSVLWVLPAWEADPHLAQQDAENTVASALKGDKQRLAVLWSARHLRIFSEDIFPQGHYPTDYRRWLGSDSPYNISYARGYEPWGIIARQRHVQMPYDIRFRGCFRDKVTHVASLAYGGVAFAAVPDAWLVHQPHALSAAASIATGRKRASGRVQALQQVIYWRGMNTTRFMLHKAHSLVTSDEALGAMAGGRYTPVVGRQFAHCRATLPWMS